jgi:galactose mutarotase-like enzyme
MSLYHIENDFLSIKVNAFGAELSSLYNKLEQQELLWQADSKFWARHAPVLFPIVGRLKDHQYEFGGKSYTLPQHGFARDSVFELVENTSDRLEFALLSNEKTKENYPFDFEFRVAYQLDGNRLTQSFWVKNTGSQTMYCAIGAHPAFIMDGAFENYTLHFDQSEPNLERLILEGGLLGKVQKFRLVNDQLLSLNHQLFEQDALVFETLNSRAITLRKEGEKVLTMQFKDFPNFGVWTKPGAPFLCLEPWWGFADKTLDVGELSEKSGAHAIAPHQSKALQFKVVIH